MAIKGLLLSLATLLCILSPVSITSCASQPSACEHADVFHPSAKQLFNEVALPTYKILASSESGDWSGSAVAIGTNTLVTAAHVVTDVVPLKSIYVFSKLGKKKVIASAKVLKADIKSDLAVITTDVPLPYWAEVMEREEIAEFGRWGSRVWVSGHALGCDEPVITDGTINSTDDFGFIRYSAAQIFGNSGGPVFARTPSGFKVMSIAQAGYVSGFSMVTHMSLGANPYTLNTFLFGGK